MQFQIILSTNHSWPKFSKFNKRMLLSGIFRTKRHFDLLHKFLANQPNLHEYRSKRLKSPSQSREKPKKASSTFRTPIWLFFGKGFAFKNAARHTRGIPEGIVQSLGGGDESQKAGGDWREEGWARAKFHLEVLDVVAYWISCCLGDDWRSWRSWRTTERGGCTC